LKRGRNDLYVRGEKRKEADTSFAKAEKCYQGVYFNLGEGKRGGGRR